MFEIESRGMGASSTFMLRDRATRTSATIFPQFGFNCASFRSEVGGVEREFLYASADFPRDDPKGSRHGIPILAPFPNRIRGGRFHYAGRDYQLPQNHGANAIHGFVLNQPWRIVASGVSNEEGAWVTGQFQLSIDRPEAVSLWPADFQLDCTYRLQGRSLSAEFVVRNPSTQMLPFGLGTHAYFRFPLEGSSAADCRVSVPAGKRVELADCLPTGVIHPVTPPTDLRSGVAWHDRNLDDVYTGLEPAADGAMHHEIVDHKAGARLTLSHDASFPFVVVFVPPHREAICIEPYTCVTDALNLNDSGLATGLWHLEPGTSRRLALTMAVGESAARP